MCLGDHAEIWNAVWRTARREHHCGECGFVIDTATRYLEIRTLFDGRWSTEKRCMVCDAHWQVYRRFNDGCETAGELRDWEVEMQRDIAGEFVVLSTTVASESRAAA